MRKILPFIIAIIIVVTLVAQSVFVTAGPEVTLEWDPVTSLEGGDPVPSGDSITYEVMLNSTDLGPVSTASFPITLPSQGLHTFSVRTVLTRDGGDTAKSEYATLSVVILYRPARPTRLRVTE